METTGLVICLFTALLLSEQGVLGSLVFRVHERGSYALSVDGKGGNVAAYSIRALKPRGGTVHSAYVMAASTATLNFKIPDGFITVLDFPIQWSISVPGPSPIPCWNHWADVTALVKPFLDAAAPGLVDVSFVESDPAKVEGTILAVIFNDPSQTSPTSISLIFGTQSPSGDTFKVLLDGPFSPVTPGLLVDFSLGITSSYQSGSTFQSSTLKVDGATVSISAGGSDDGTNDNGALFTVGGIGDSNSNPNPTAHVRDDELYNLIPFIAPGAKKFSIYVTNPLNGDNIFFAALASRRIGSTLDIGTLTLSPPLSCQFVHLPYTLSVQLSDPNFINCPVVFSSGERSYTTAVNIDGEASWTFSSPSEGVDEIVAIASCSEAYNLTGEVARSIWVKDYYTEGEVINWTIPEVRGGSTVVVLWGDGTESTIPVHEDTFGLVLSHRFIDDAPTLSNIATFTQTITNGPTIEKKTALINIDNAPPSVDYIEAPFLVKTSQDFHFITLFSDPGLVDSHVCKVDWGDGGVDELVLPVGYSNCFAGHDYKASGIHQVALKISDDDGGVVSTLYKYLVSYDEDDVIIGSGWLTSPAGALDSDALLAGTANFGIISDRRQSSFTIFFDFPSFLFQSTKISSVVQFGDRAQVVGKGSVVGDDTKYSFQLTIEDTDPVTNGNDRIRLIVYKKTGPVYDNLGLAGSSLESIGETETQAIGGGSIIIRDQVDQ
eukprot:TRINITY_DN3615_c0_g1_i1.p1 TRINITY_DN3615_c0_g1~~TRINITY_DN3615_c0_g1_i1.p1  ORF type:complete len:718 (+),score=131.67 TRINITY_DN3615_c0_g1_i1:1-2154(+)